MQWVNQKKKKKRAKCKSKKRTVLHETNYSLTTEKYC